MEVAAHVQKLYDLLGRETVLLPAVAGDKMPVPFRWEAEYADLPKKDRPIFAWREVSFADTQEAGYQEQLAKGNIGVVLGEASGGLCSIDIDDDRDMEPFFELNPGLRNTLISQAARGCQVWVRCIDDPKYRQLGIPRHPDSHGLKFKMGYRDQVNDAGQVSAGAFGEWRANGNQSIIYGKHPKGMDYRLLNEAPVMEIRFRDIVWPPTLDALPWTNAVDDALEQEYGEPWVLDKNEQPTGMNETFFAGLYAFEHYVLYEKDEERYYLYEDATGVWKRSGEEDVLTSASKMMLDLSRRQGEAVVGTNRFRSVSKMRNVSAYLKGIVGQRGCFKNKRGLIHLKNGMIDLTASEDGALRLVPHSPDYFSRNQIPVAFDPEAECPRFLNDLLGAGLTDDDIALMQRWGGLLLLQDNVYQKIMILRGTPGGGKSTVMSVFQKMVGQENCAQLRTEQLLERFEMAAFIGKSTLIGADVPGNFLMQRGAYKLKQLTGGDFFQAEIKTARDLVTLYGNFNVGITCNSRLRVKMDSDAGAWDRRLVIIDYEAPKPKEPISNFDDLLVREEGSGILNWMIEGALMNLAKGKFGMSSKQTRRVKDLIEESDSVRSFLSRCVQRADRNASITTDELIEAYHGFCDASGWDAAPAGTLEKQLPNLMLEMFRVNKGNNVKRDGTARRGYTRVRLVDPDDESTIYDEEDDAPSNYSQDEMLEDETPGYEREDA